MTVLFLNKRLRTTTSITYINNRILDYQDDMAEMQ